MTLLTDARWQSGSVTLRRPVPIAISTPLLKQLINAGRPATRGLRDQQYTTRTADERYWPRLWRVHASKTCKSLCYASKHFTRVRYRDVLHDEKCFYLLEKCTSSGAYDQLRGFESNAPFCLCRSIDHAAAGTFAPKS